MSLDPSNSEYLDVLNQIENGGAAYRRQAGSFGGYQMRGNPCTNLFLCFILQFFCCGGRFPILCC